MSIIGRSILCGQIFFSVTDTDCLPLCSQVLELMVTLQVSGDSSHTHGLVVKESQKHWINFTSTPPSLSPLFHCLSLSNV